MAKSRRRIAFPNLGARPSSASNSCCQTRKLRPAKWDPKVPCAPRRRGKSNKERRLLRRIQSRLALSGHPEASACLSAFGGKADNTIRGVQLCGFFGNAPLRPSGADGDKSLLPPSLWQMRSSRPRLSRKLLFFYTHLTAPIQRISPFRHGPEVALRRKWGKPHGGCNGQSSQRNLGVLLHGSICHGNCRARCRNLH